MTDEVILSDIEFSSTILNTIIIINYATLLDTRIMLYKVGEFNLRNSLLTLRQSISLQEIADEVHIERNILHAEGITISEPYGLNFPVYIKNNVFLKTYTGTPITPASIHIFAPGTIIVQYNSFLYTDTDGIAINYAYGNALQATENYWGTTDTAVIDNMIFDMNDDVTRTVEVVYMPILSAPHPDTPIP